MSPNLILGNFLIMFGLIKIGTYFFGKNRLALTRLETFKKKFGAEKGVWIYFLLYVTLPITTGILILFFEYRHLG